MVAIAAIGLIAFIVHLTVRKRDRATSGFREQQVEASKPKWFEYLLAVVAVPVSYTHLTLPTILLV